MANRVTLQLVALLVGMGVVACIQVNVPPAPTPDLSGTVAAAVASALPPSPTPTVEPTSEPTATPVPPSPTPIPTQVVLLNPVPCPPLANALSLAFAGSHQAGCATITAVEGGTRIAVKLAPVMSQAQPIHVHQGTCSNVGNITHKLQDVVGGTSDTVLDVVMADPKRFGGVINVHLSAADIRTYRTYTACGDLRFAGDAAKGQQAFRNLACSGCHSTGEDRIVGPGLAGIGLRAATRKPGTAADDYLAESISSPNAYVVDGFPANVMPTGFGGASLADLIAYLKSL